MVLPSLHHNTITRRLPTRGGTDIYTPLHSLHQHTGSCNVLLRSEQSREAIRQGQANQPQATGGKAIDTRHQSRKSRQTQNLCACKFIGTYYVSRMTWERQVRCAGVRCLGCVCFLLLINVFEKTSCIYKYKNLFISLPGDSQRSCTRKSYRVTQMQKALSMTVRAYYL